jgi:uncharacterized protein YecE (DUF72 family)
VTVCLHDMPESAPPPRANGPFVYARFHGAGQRYGGSYASDVLGTWADRMSRWSTAGLPVWAYFNNDIDGHAVRDAQRLREMVARRLGNR